MRKRALLTDETRNDCKNVSRFTHLVLKYLRYTEKYITHTTHAHCIT